MTPETIVQLVMSLGVIPGLFVYLLYDSRKEHKEERRKSTEREDALMNHIKQSDETQKAIMKSIEQIATSQQVMQTDMQFIQKDIENLKRSE